jgi:hypothetical protein
LPERRSTPSFDLGDSTVPSRFTLLLPAFTLCGTAGSSWKAYSILFRVLHSATTWDATTEELEPHVTVGINGAVSTRNTVGHTRKLTFKLSPRKTPHSTARCNMQHAILLGIRPCWRDRRTTPWLGWTFKQWLEKEARLGRVLHHLHAGLSEPPSIKPV